MSEQEILDEIVRRLRARFDVRQVILFGSRAANASRADSDYDIWAEVESDIPYWPRQAIGSQLRRGLGVACDLIIATPVERQHEESAPWTIASQVARTGKVIYARQ